MLLLLLLVLVLPLLIWPSAVFGLRGSAVGARSPELVVVVVVAVVAANSRYSGQRRTAPNDDGGDGCEGFFIHGPGVHTSTLLPAGSAGQNHFLLLSRFTSLFSS